MYYFELHSLILQDLTKERTVSAEEANAMATKHKMPYIEVSSKLNKNCELAFATLAQRMLAQLEMSEETE